MAFNKNERGDAPRKRAGGMRRRKKVCVFCGKDNTIDYKDTAKLKKYDPDAFEDRNNFNIFGFVKKSV